MSGWKRLLWGLTGKASHRLPRQAQLLGAPASLVDALRRLPEEEQEVSFLEFIEGRHGGVLDWRARLGDVREVLEPLLTEQERALLPASGDERMPADAAVDRIRQAIAPAGRTLLQTESLGDFSVLLIVPESLRHDFVRVIGPWLIGGETPR